jgi:hypothetical protein
MFYIVGGLLKPIIEIGSFFGFFGNLTNSCHCFHVQNLPNLYFCLGQYQIFQNGAHVSNYSAATCGPSQCCFSENSHQSAIFG